MYTMTTIRAKVSRSGADRLHIEIPKIYFDKLPRGTVVVIRPLKEVQDDESKRNN